MSASLKPDNDQTTEAQPPNDEFVAGKTNALNRAFFRFVAWLFRGPHFPAEPIWLLAALALTELGFLLMRQQPEFWIDPSLSANVSFLGAPLTWGAWPVLALHVGYILLAGLALKNLNLKLAFPLWTTLSLLHMLAIPSSFACWSTPAFPFFDQGACSQWHIVAVLVVGSFWALELGQLARQGIISIGQEQQPTATPKYPLLQIFSIVWIALLAIGVGLAATPAKANWQPIQTGQAPSARMFAALGYDPNRQVAILFGGTAEWTPETDWIALGDTWQWDGTDWQQLTPATNPPPRRNSVMAYDPSRGVLVMFGGSGQAANKATLYLNDTWEWDGQNWQERHSEVQPPARHGANLYYDPQAQKIILYAGYYKSSTGQAVFMDDVWEWDGQAWTQVTLEQSRVDSGAALLYYEPEQRPILMDGQGLWVLQDSRWFQPNYPLTPPARWSGNLALEAQHQQVVLFGGYQGQEVFADTWTYSGTTWKKLTTQQQPPARYGSNLFFDLKRNRLVLLGGYDGKALYNDQWELVLP
jgi:hypothetical protein